MQSSTDMVGSKHLSSAKITSCPNWNRFKEATMQSANKLNEVSTIKFVTYNIIVCKELDDEFLSIAEKQNIKAGSTLLLAMV